MKKSSRNQKVSVENSLAHITTYRAGIAQASMHRNVQRISNEILKPFGITKMQWIIIGSILDSGSSGVRSSDLAESLSVTMPYLTNALSILETNGCIIRSTNNTDGRSKITKINPKYSSTCADIEKAMRDGLRKAVYSQVSEDEFLTYMKVVFKLQARVIQKKS